MEPHLRPHGPTPTSTPTSAPTHTLPPPPPSRCLYYISIEVRVSGASLLTMPSLFDKAKDKLKREKSNDSSVSRTSSLRRSGSSRRKKEKEDKEKRLSGLRYETGSKNGSKESVVSKEDKNKQKKEIKKDDVKDDMKNEGEYLSVVDKGGGNGTGNETTSAEASAAKETTKETAEDVSNEGSNEGSNEFNGTPNEGDTADATTATNTANATAEDTIAATTTASPPPRDGAVSPKTPKAFEPIPPHSPRNQIPVADDTETSPLLARPPSDIVQASNYLSSPRLSIGVLVILVVLVIIIYLIYHNLGAVITESVHPQLNSIHLLGLTDSGLDVAVNTSIAINYDNISSIFYQNLFKFGAVMLSKLYLHPQLPISVMLNSLDSFNITTPEQLDISLLNKDTTYLQFNSTVQVSDSNLIKLLQDLLTEDEVLVNVKTNVTTDVSMRLFTLRNQKFHIDQDLLFNNNLSSMVDVTETTMTFNNESQTFDMELDINYNNQFINQFVDNKSFKGFIKDTNDDLVPIADIKTHAQDAKLLAKVLIGQIPDCLIESNAINKVITDFLEKRQPDIYFMLTSFDKSLPKWLNNILSQLVIRLPNISPTLNYNIPEYSLVSGAIEVSDKVIVSSNVTVDNSFPIEVKDLQQRVYIKDKVLEGHMKGDFHNNYFQNQLVIDSMDDHTIGYFVNEIIHNKSIGFDLEAQIDILTVETPILSDTFKFNLKDQLQLAIPISVNELIEQLEIKIYDITVANSNEQQLKLFVDLHLNNLGNVSVDLQQPMMVNLMYNGSRIGNMEIDNLYIPPSGADNKAEVSVFQTPDNLLQLSEFVNKFIAGKNDIEIEVDFECESHLKALNEVKLPSFNLPQIGFDKEGNQGNQGNQNQVNQSPFLLETTIHLMGTYIELLALNPVNKEVQVDLHQVIASYEGQELGRTGNKKITLAPGIHKTDKIPVQLSGMGSEVLKKALNGAIEVEIVGEFTVGIDKFELESEYIGEGIKANIRL